MQDWHPQDRLLVIEALVMFAGDPRDLTPRQQRAWELAEMLAASEGLTPSEAVGQIDSSWSG